jgi:hypothetical protein
MTDLSAKADPLARALAPLVRNMLLDEVRRHAAADRQHHADAIADEIMQASRKVAKAADRLAEARFSGAPERDAHRRVVKAAAELGGVMRKHGRMPEKGKI